MPKTGRTHQIRVHMAAIGHPIVGDRTYGSQERWKNEFNVHRPLLHAEQIIIAHPKTGKRLTFKAPWPKDFKAAEKLFRKAFAIGILFFGLLSQTIHAENKTSSTTSKHTSSSKTTPSSSAYRKLKSDVTDLRSQMDTVQKQLTEFQQSFNDLGIAGRLRDLEKAVSELNGKAVADNNTLMVFLSPFTSVNLKNLFIQKPQN